MSMTERAIIASQATDAEAAEIRKADSKDAASLALLVAAEHGLSVLDFQRSFYSIETFAAAARKVR
jgi:hypothetical protein